MISIIAALAIVVFVALNPAGRLSSSRDARRTSDVDSHLTAIHQYIVDNKGSLPPGLSTGMLETQLGTGNAATCSPLFNATSGCNVAASTACVDLTSPLSKYLKSIPTDPLNGDVTATKYSVTVGTNNIVTVRACSTEGSSNISSSR